MVKREMLILVALRQSGVLRGDNLLHFSDGGKFDWRICLRKRQITGRRDWYRFWRLTARHCGGLE